MFVAVIVSFASFRHDSAFFGYAPDDRNARVQRGLSAFRSDRMRETFPGTGWQEQTDPLDVSRPVPTAAVPAKRAAVYKTRRAYFTRTNRTKSQSGIHLAVPAPITASAFVPSDTFTAFACTGRRTIPFRSEPLAKETSASVLCLGSHSPPDIISETSESGVLSTRDMPTRESYGNATCRTLRFLQSTLLRRVRARTGPSGYREYPGRLNPMTVYIGLPMSLPYWSSTYGPC